MNGALWLLPLFAVGYALWAFFRLWRMERNEPADGIVAEDTPCRQEIIGRSRFVLDPRHSRPQAAVESETEKVTATGGLQERLATMFVCTFVAGESTDQHDKPHFDPEPR